MFDAVVAYCAVCCVLLLVTVGVFLFGFPGCTTIRVDINQAHSSMHRGGINSCYIISIICVHQYFET